jgi:hypothetical protein
VGRIHDSTPVGGIFFINQQCGRGSRASREDFRLD